MITVVDYDPSWPRRFEALRQEYAAAFARAAVPVVAIEHVGSASVPGLAAKPVIDCDIVIAERDLAAATEVLTGRGFRPSVSWASRCGTTSDSATPCAPGPTSGTATAPSSSESRRPGQRSRSTACARAR